MNGYPKHIATVQDFKNLLAVPEFRERVLADLRAIQDADDETAKRVISISEDGTEETEDIDNPMPLWRIKGFASRTAVAVLIAQYPSSAAEEV